MQRTATAIQRLAEKLVEPNPQITDPRQRRTASVLAGLMLPLLGLSVIGTAAYVMKTGILAVEPTLAGLTFAGVYLLSRSRQPQAASLMLVIVTTLINAAALPTSDQVVLASLWTLLPILLAAILLPRWPAVGVAVANVVLATVALLMVGGGSAAEIATALSLLYFIAPVVLVTKFARERDIARLAQVNRELQAARDQAEAAREQAEQADRVKSQFLASMSHELRTPLNAILNFTQLLAMGVLGPINDRQKETLDEVVDSGKHLLGLINDVLDMSKIQGGMLALFVEEDVDVNEIIRSAAAATRVLLADKPVELVLEVDNPLPPVVGDRRRLQQVLLNLLGNAARFTAAGRITLRARQQGDRIAFAVIDTGPGIAEEDLAIIFQPFQQTETGIRHAGGTGLGLPISSNLVEAHGGRLQVDSVVGQGSTFFFDLPIVCEPLRQQLSRPPEAAHAQP